ncbi:cyclin-D5-1-like [Cornus florida]|uniref:cyclin-D5-1-like n=1 Tax=Cornus florida TaxID=4283 RepID=UPI00289AB39E|nr:cyclin-D5-1-like [Cornus florida]
MDDSSHSTLSLSTLLCQEPGTPCLADHQHTSISLNMCHSSSEEDDDDDEYLQVLLQREIGFGFKTHQFSRDHMIKCARLDAITWILNTRALFRFRFQTAYLSVTYFDQFLSRRVIDSEKSWAIRLLSVACLSLAAKMEECRVPALSEFPVEDYSFESRVIQRMELLVLNTLEWKMGSITPFAYIHCFITKLCKDSLPKNIVSKIVQLILALMRDVNLMDHRPSVIAGAATMVALDQKLTRQTLECQINALSPTPFLEIEDVFYCYNRMLELDSEEIKVVKRVLSPEMSSIQLGGNDVFENSSISCDVSAKRKSVAFEFDDCHQNCVVPEEKRQR